MPAVPSRVEWVLSLWGLGDANTIPPFQHPRLCPTLSAFLETGANAAECFSSGRDQGRTSSSPECPGLTQSRTRELWTWECSGCECTPALLLQLCKKFPFSQPCAIGGFTAIPTSLDFLHSKLLLFTFSLTLQSMVGFKSAFQHGNEWINFLLSDE